MKRLLGVVVVVCACAEAMAAWRPVAERAAVRLLRKPVKGGNAILFVQFGRTPAAKNVLTLDDGQGAATLRDDGVAPDEKSGDGTHSAYLHVDVEQLRTRQARTLAAKSLPLFVGRERVGHATAALVDGPLALKDLPVIPNRRNYVRPVDGKELSLVLRFVPIRAGALIPIYPTLFTDDPSPADSGKAAASTQAPSLTETSALGMVLTDDDPSLILTAASAVNDVTRTYKPCTASGAPRGNWTFAHLMIELAQDTAIPAPQFIENWLRTWQSQQTINTFNVPARIVLDDIIRNWHAVSAGPELDLDQAPFVLVAIVNRIDLGELDSDGRTVGAGEARFVFAATGRLGNNPCTELPILVIFEYKVNIRGCHKVKQWARQWQDLEAFNVQGTNYRNALEAITLQFTEAGTNPSQWPNHSSLAQIRTNMFHAGDAPALDPWEMREFRLPALTVPVRGIRGNLFETTVKQTPDLSFNGSLALAIYARGAADAIVAEEHVIPETLSGNAFLAGSAPLPGDRGGATAKPQFFWDGPGPSPSSLLSVRANLRHKLSLNTCNGCHGDETGGVFTHVSEKGKLSGFLTGTLVRDPAGEKVGLLDVFRYFNDLQFRRQRMNAILNDPCWAHAYLEPLNSVH